MANVVNFAATLDLDWWRRFKPMGGRLAITTAGYIAAGLTVLITVFLARRHLSAVELRIFLSYLLLSTVASGLEPGTAKSAAVDLRSASPDAVLCATALKALAISPILAVALALRPFG